MNTLLKAALHLAVNAHLINACNCFREKARSMFYHGYESYMKFGYPFDELQPLSCTGHDTWGRYYGITTFVWVGGGGGRGWTTPKET